MKLLLLLSRRARDVREEAVHQELMVKDHQSKQEIRDLEEELPQWRTILDTGNNPGGLGEKEGGREGRKAIREEGYIPPPLLTHTLEFGPDVYAILKGKVVDFLMTSREVVLGRGSPSSRVDFDLSMEAPAFKVSRRQVSEGKTPYANPLRVHRGLAKGQYEVSFHAHTHTRVNTHTHTHFQFL